MHTQPVSLEIVLHGEVTTTNKASERLLSTVRSKMADQVRLVQRLLSADVAGKFGLRLSERS